METILKISVAEHAPYDSTKNSYFGRIDLKRKMRSILMLSIDEVEYEYTTSGFPVSSNNSEEIPSASEAVNTPIMKKIKELDDRITNKQAFAFIMEVITNTLKYSALELKHLKKGDSIDIVIKTSNKWLTAYIPGKQSPVRVLLEA